MGVSARQAALSSEGEENRLCWRLVPRCPSGILVVVFSQARVPPGNFGLSRLFATTKHACLFLNSSNNDWYLGHDRVIDRLINQAVSQVSPDRILYYGCSMGAYGAIATTLRRLDGALIGFGAEIDLGLLGSQSATYVPNLRERRTGTDVSRRLKALEGIDVQLVFGALDPIDAHQAVLAEEVLGNRSTSPVTVLVSPHASHDHLYSLNVIRQLIGRFDRRVSELCDRKGLIAPYTLQELGSYAALHQRFLRGERLNEAEVDSNKSFMKNPAARRLYADWLLQEGQMDQAIELYHELDTLHVQDDVLSKTPKRYRKEITARLIDLLRKADRELEANALAQAASARYAPRGGQAWHTA